MTLRIVLVTDDADLLALHTAHLGASGAEVTPGPSDATGTGASDADVIVVWTDDERRAVERWEPSSRRSLVVIGHDDASHDLAAVDGLVRLTGPVDPVTLRRVVADVTETDATASDVTGRSSGRG